MNNQNKSYDLENNPILDLLDEVIRSCQPKASILNLKRYFEVLVAKEALDDILRKNDSEPSKIQIHPMFCSASLSAEVENLEVSDTAAFQIAMAKADNFEIYPLTNGRMRIAFMFRNFLTSINQR